MTRLEMVEPEVFWWAWVHPSYYGLCRWQWCANPVEGEQ